MSKSVFISSTSKDLGEYRAVVDKAIRRLELRPINMDDFGSQPGGAGNVSLREVQKAEFFVGIVAHRYGYVPDGMERSITEQEYDLAVKRNIPRLMYIIDPAFNWPAEYVENDAVAQARLAKFRQKIERNDVRSLFTTSDVLAADVTADLTKLLGDISRRELTTRRVIAVLAVALVLVITIVVANPILRGRAIGIVGLGTRTITPTSNLVYLTQAPSSTLSSDVTKLINQGMSLNDDESFEDAVAAFTEALSIDPQNATALSGRGFANAGLGNLDDAQTDYDQAIALKPDYSNVYINRGLLNLTRGNHAAAGADFVRWMDLNSSGQPAQKLTFKIGDSQEIEMQAGRVYRISFAAKSGQKLDFHADVTDGTVDPILALLDLAGKPVDADDDSGEKYNALIAGYSIPSDGDYTLLVSHTLGGADGTLNVSIEPSS